MYVDELSFKWKKCKSAILFLLRVFISHLMIVILGKMRGVFALYTSIFFAFIYIFMISDIKRNFDRVFPHQFFISFYMLFNVCYTLFLFLLIVKIRRVRNLSADIIIIVLTFIYILKNFL